MPKFKVGDKVVRTKDNHCGMKKGDYATVTAVFDAINIFSENSVSLKEFIGTHADYNLELADPPVVVPQKPIGVRVDKFVDSDGKKMVMVSMTIEQAEVLRTVLGHQGIICATNRFTSPLYNALKVVCPKMGRATEAKTWSYQEFETSLTEEERNDE